MPAKKDSEKKPAAQAKPKQADAKQEQGADVPAPNPQTGRQPAAPKDNETPMNYDARGDAHPMAVEPDHSPEANRPDGSTMPRTVDPSLHPSAQQPGESAEDFAKRTAATPSQAGVYDAAITRDKAPS